MSILMSIFVKKLFMTDFSDDKTLTKPILEMITVANEYCHFLENIEKRSTSSILEFVNRIAPLLYLKGSLLPEIEVDNPELNEKFVTAEDWEIIFNSLRGKFGKDDEFWMIDPQYVNENEPLKASLSENLADIYQDMKDLLLLFQKNTFAARQNAISDCALTFSNHWGYKVSNIMTKVHHMLYDGEVEAPPYSDTLDYI